MLCMFTLVIQNISAKYSSKTFCDLLLFCCWYEPVPSPTFYNCLLFVNTTELWIELKFNSVLKSIHFIPVNRLPNKSGTVQYCKRGPKGNNIFAYSWWVCSDWYLFYTARVKISNKNQHFGVLVMPLSRWLRKYSVHPFCEERDLCKHYFTSCTLLLEITCSIMLWISWCRETYFSPIMLFCYFETLKFLFMSLPIAPPTVRSGESSFKSYFMYGSHKCFI